MVLRYTVAAVPAVALTIMTATPSNTFVLQRNRARSATISSRSISPLHSGPPLRPSPRSATAVGMPAETSTPPPQHYTSISSIAESAQQWLGRLLSSLALPARDDREGLSGADASSSYLLHSGPTTRMLLEAPSVASFTLARGWSDDGGDGGGSSSLEAFERSVRDVVRANPILTGRAISAPGTDGVFGGGEVRVVPGAFPPDGPGRHPFVEVVDARTTAPSPLGLPDGDLLDYVDAHVATRIPRPCAPTIDQIRDRSPLFWATVVLLPDGYACFYIGVSHMLGDITTYTNLLDQLSTSHSGRHEPRPIDWDNRVKATHQISPEDFSDRDTCISYGLPFFIGLGANMLVKGERKQKFLTLSEEKIRAKRKELCAAAPPGSGDDDDADGSGSRPASLSSNDVITAALCEACGSSDIFAFTRSMREMRHTQYKNMAGNLYVEVPFSRAAGTDPNAVRRIVERGRYYERDGLPLAPFLAGRVGRISSCVAPRGMKFEFGGTETVCHSPPRAFLDFCPFDCAVIFSMDRDHVGVMHNFLEIDESGLLGQLKA